jgi:hypothetical protein
MSGIFSYYKLESPIANPPPLPALVVVVVVVEGKVVVVVVVRGKVVVVVVVGGHSPFLTHINLSSSLDIVQRRFEFVLQPISLLGIAILIV